MSFLSDSLYAKYILEREGAELIESSSTFITYKIDGKECFIANTFTEESKRKSGHFKSILKDLEAIARSRGCEFLSANIHLRDKHASATMAVSLALGFRIEKADCGIIMITKLLGDKSWAE